MAVLFVLSGCVADSTLPSQNVGVLLSTPESERADVENKLGRNLAIASTQTASPPAPALSPNVKNALVPGNAAATPAQTAVLEVADSEPVGGQNNRKSGVNGTKESTSLFGSLFANNTKNSLRVDNPARGGVARTKTNGAASTSSQVKLAGLSAKSSTQSRSKPRQRRRPRIKATIRDGAVGLPGVRLKKLFGIDTEETEEFDEPLNVANVPNLAHRGTHGLLLQRPGVKVGCFPRKLVGILKRVERRFGRTPIVTSGYRSPAHNRRVRGARNSTHVRCHAADIQVKGISKWALAKYLRSMPGRGGVGTYCHTRSVHVDIGKRREWHYCKRRRKKRRRS